MRTGKNPASAAIDLPTLLRVFRPVYSYFEKEGYFQEAFGYDCVDAGYTPGTLGSDMEAVVLLQLRKIGLWPVLSQLDNYSEDDLFDMLEFLHEHCSKPVEREYHSWGECGWHCSTFDRAPGQEEFREKVNPLLRVYQSGFELSPGGEILGVPEAGLEPLVKARLPLHDPDNVEARIEAACQKFRRHSATLNDRRDAIRDLADVLEFLRPKLQVVLRSKDERDLFNLVNNFGIRHHNENQKTNYDRAIWYSWMFYYYLATIHAVLRLIAKNG